MALIKLNNRSIKDVTSLPFGVGNLIHIQSQTASDSSSISFTNINGTYKEYQFYFIDIHPRTDNTGFQFNVSTDGGSNYNVTKTSTAFGAYHEESDAGAGLEYSTSQDLAQGTGYQNLCNADNGSDADQSISGSLILFNPSSTTYVKHWISQFSGNAQENTNRNFLTAGYANTTSAINAINFKQSSGNFDGTIALFGVV